MATKKSISSAARILSKEKQGIPVTRALRFVAQRYRSLSRGEFLIIAEECGINKATASTQFYRARHN